MKKCWLVSVFNFGDRLNYVVTTEDKIQVAIADGAATHGIDIGACTVEREDVTDTQYTLSYMRYDEEQMLVQVEDVNMID